MSLMLGGYVQIQGKDPARGLYQIGGRLHFYLLPSFPAPSGLLRSTHMDPEIAECHQEASRDDRKETRLLGIAGSSQAEGKHCCRSTTGELKSRPGKGPGDMLLGAILCGLSEGGCDMAWRAPLVSDTEAQPLTQGLSHNPRSCEQH